MKQHNIKLICSDIDGTLLDKNRALSSKTKAVFNLLKDIYPSVLISSRMPKSLRQLQAELCIQKNPIIAYNGSLIQCENQTLFSQEMPFSLLEKMVKYIEGTTIHLSLYHKDEWMVPTNDYWAKREAHNTKVDPVIAPLDKTLADWKKRGISAHKVMCMGEEEEIEILYRQLELHQNEINAYRSKSTYIEVSHIEQDKASAIRFLLKKKYPEIEMDNVIAFGDNYNDATLLEKVGLGVAVANAKKEVLAIANKITNANIEDGVALFLEKELLK
jgi:Cof subfamily protein (haloacid dehalogenase superfamily)